MKLQNQLFKIFTLLVLFVSSICANALFAQTDSNKTMTITIVAVDEEGNQTTQTIVKEADEVNENEIEAEIDALIEKLSGDNTQLDINVNVEIEGDGSQGIEMVEEEQTITIDMTGEDTKMMIIETDTDELDEETKMKLEKALEGTDIKLNDLLNGKLKSDGAQRRIKMKRGHRGRSSNSNKAFLGVYVNADKTSDGKSVSGGISINIVKESGAAKAGLRNGDILNSVDGKAVSDFNSLITVLSSYKPGDVVKLNYTRDNNTQTTDATLTGPQNRNQKSWHLKKSRHYKSKSNGCCDPNDTSTWPAGCCDGDKKATNDKAQLGVYLDEGDFDGAKVSEIIKGSDAEKAGIKAGAIITKVGKTKIKNVDELIDAIGTYKIGEEAKVHWVNGNSKSKKKVVFTKPVKKSSGCCSSNTPQNKITDKKVIIRKKKFERRNDNVVEEVIENNNTSKLDFKTIDIFPNPTGGIITLKFEIPNNKDTTIELLDVSGRAVFSEVNSDFDGSYSNEIDLTGNPEGIYILSITQDEQSFTEKIIFNKQ